MTDENSQQLGDIKYLFEQLTTARKEISNLRQQIKSLGYVHQKECDVLRQTLAEWKCSDCRSKLVEPEAATDAIETISDEIVIKPIGIITTHFPEKRGTPRQPGLCSDIMGKITLSNEILTNPEHALEGLNDFSHMWILFHFHKNESTHIRAKVAPPRLNGIRTGVFGSRSPHRPVPIGLSLVKIEQIEESTIYFSGVDMIDGTPVLDIKPYIPTYDCPNSEVPSLQSPGPTTSRRLDGRETTSDVLPQCDGDGSPINLSLRLENTSLRPESRIGEREAPDGEEGDYSSSNNYIAAPPTSNQNVIDPSGHENGIRVPSWINQPPIAQLNVNFSERALTQLQSIKGSVWQQTKNAITNILREDPRSVYLRRRWGNQFYTFRISEVHVSCKFDDNSHTVTVFQVRDVESLEDN